MCVNSASTVLGGVRRREAPPTRPKTRTGCIKGSPETSVFGRGIHKGVRQRPYVLVGLGEAGTVSHRPKISQSTHPDNFKFLPTSDLHRLSHQTFGFRIKKLNIEAKVLGPETKVLDTLTKI